MQRAVEWSGVGVSGCSGEIRAKHQSSICMLLLRTMALPESLQRYRWLQSMPPCRGQSHRRRRRWSRWSLPSALCVRYESVLLAEFLLAALDGDDVSEEDGLGGTLVGLLLLEGVDEVLGEDHPSPR